MGENRSAMSGMLDHPLFVQSLFHARKVPIEYVGDQAGVEGLYDGTLPTPDPSIQLGYRLMVHEPASPLLLHFHGNGEIASEVIHRRTLANKCGVSILAVDYRGYGWSTGAPLISTLVQDAHAITAALPELLKEHGLSPKTLWVMGRSLGSVWACELANSSLHLPLGGVIIESGFASLKKLPIAEPALKMLGPAAAQIPEPYPNAAKLQKCSLPLLVIHGDADAVVPHWHGKQLHEMSGSTSKLLVTIPGGAHNDLTARGGDQYYAAAAAFVTSGGDTDEVNRTQAKQCCTVL